MSNQKKFTDEEIKNLGLRIKSCRALTGLTQEEFGNACGFPVPSIKTWEFGSVIPRSEGLKKYCESLKNFGLFVSTEWLLYGAGTGPAYFLDQPKEPNYESEGYLATEVISIKENFESSRRKNKENPVFFEVIDDEMDPLICLGDFIGGILQEKSSFKNIPNKPMVVKLENGNYAARVVYLIEGDFFIASLKNPVVQKAKLDAFGTIKLHYVR